MTMLKTIIIFLTVVLFTVPRVSSGGEAILTSRHSDTVSWTFVNIPDCLNVDIEYP